MLRLKLAVAAEADPHDKVSPAPASFVLSSRLSECFEKREILAEDTKFFEMGWMYHFNGINGPKDKVVPMWMELAYKKLYHPDNKQEPRGIE